MAFGFLLASSCFKLQVYKVANATRFLECLLLNDSNAVININAQYNYQFHSLKGIIRPVITLSDFSVPVIPTFGMYG